MSNINQLKLFNQIQGWIRNQNKLHPEQPLRRQLYDQSPVKNSIITIGFFTKSFFKHQYKLRATIDVLVDSNDHLAFAVIDYTRLQLLEKQLTSNSRQIMQECYQLMEYANQQVKK